MAIQRLVRSIHRNFFARIQCCLSFKQRTMTQHEPGSLQSCSTRKRNNLFALTAQGLYTSTKSIRLPGEPAPDQRGLATWVVKASNRLFSECWKAPLSPCKRKAECTPKYHLLEMVELRANGYPNMQVCCLYIHAVRTLNPITARSETYHIDTTNVLFILSGAFVGLENIIKQRVSKGVGEKSVIPRSHY